MTFSKPETYSEPWYIQNPGALKILAYSKPKAYSDIYDEAFCEKSWKIEMENSFAILA